MLSASSCPGCAPWRAYWSQTLDPIRLSPRATARRAPRAGRRQLLALCAVSVALAAPAFAQPKGAAPATMQLGSTGHTVSPPAAWRQTPPTSQFRLAQWLVPGKGGDAEAVVFYFGPGQGGSVQANIERWASQFTAADGKPVTPKIERGKVGALPLTTVELQGNYARNIGTGMQGGQQRPEQMLISSVVESPRGNVTFQLYGPRATVEANRAAFMAMVKAMKSPA